MGNGWSKVVDVGPGATDGTTVTASFLAWFLGMAMVYSALFGVGYFLYGQTGYAAVCAVVSAGSAVWFFRLFDRLGFTE